MSVTAEEIHGLVEKYLAEYPDEAGRLARLSEALTAPGEPAGHVTSAVVLIDPQWRVLHLHYRDQHRWLPPETPLPGADDSLVGAARRELHQQLGLAPDTI